MVTMSARSCWFSASFLFRCMLVGVCYFSVLFNISNAQLTANAELHEAKPRNSMVKKENEETVVLSTANEEKVLIYLESIGLITPQMSLQEKQHILQDYLRPSHEFDLRKHKPPTVNLTSQ
ncbi:hypothetical protein [Enterovibrio norvegicus]|uniref:hypothetical protein n=1 Tax=Enterovibrio norvegicus TaxID=188144 RepID=UPI00352F85AF